MGVWWQLFHADAEECMYELVEFSGQPSGLPVTGIRFISSESAKQYLLIACCTM